MIEIHCTKNIPPLLQHIPEPPKELRFMGILPDYDKKYVTIVGSRSCTKYGLDTVEKIISELDKNIYIVSGMALGIDTAVHEACIKYGLKTIAFPGSGLNLDVLYPNNVDLVKKITQAGCIMSEYENNAKSMPWMFIKRNRLMAGISQATIVIEAEEKSGTLVTARMATDYNREVGAVPGNIFLKNHQGSNNLIAAGAHVIRSAEDIHEILGLHNQPTLFKVKSYDDCNDDERIIISSLEFLGDCNREDLIRHCDITIQVFNKSLSLLEIKGYVSSRHNNISLLL